MWLNEKLIHPVLDETLSTSESIKALQLEAWDDFIRTGDITALIASGIKKIVRTLSSWYKPGDLIMMMDPTDGATPQLLLLLEDNGTDGWSALVDGTVETIPLRQFIAEDHWKPECPEERP